MRGAGEGGRKKGGKANGQHILVFQLQCVARGGRQRAHLPKELLRGAGIDWHEEKRATKRGTYIDTKGDG